MFLSSGWARDLHQARVVLVEKDLYDDKRDDVINDQRDDSIIDRRDGVIVERVCIQFSTWFIIPVDGKISQITCLSNISTKHKPFSSICKVSTTELLCTSPK